MANKKKNLKMADKGPKETIKALEKDKASKEIIKTLEANQLPEEIIVRALERLDLLIALTKNMKSRVDILNALLQKIAYS